MSSYPASNIKWWRSKDRDGPYELIAECPPSEECKKHLGEQNITKTSFEIKDLKYPDHEFFYKCNASNQEGKASKNFLLEVYGKYIINFSRLKNIMWQLNSGILTWQHLQNVRTVKGIADVLTKFLQKVPEFFLRLGELIIIWVRSVPPIGFLANNLRDKR